VTTWVEAFNALLLLYTQVLGIPLKDQNIQVLRAQQRLHVPVVLTKEEVLDLRVRGIDFGYDKISPYISCFEARQEIQKVSHLEISIS
jgi:hypothetical protein